MRGHQLDADVVDACLRILDRGDFIPNRSASRNDTDKKTGQLAGFCFMRWCSLY